jgi:hypothetical protein
VTPEERLADALRRAHRRQKDRARRAARRAARAESAADSAALAPADDEPTGACVLRTAGGTVKCRNGLTASVCQEAGNDAGASARFFPNQQCA